MGALFFVIGLFIAGFGVLSTAQISVGVSLTVLGAAIMVSATVDNACRAIVAELKKPKA